MLFYFILLKMKINYKNCKINFHLYLLFTILVIKLSYLLKLFLL